MLQLKKNINSGKNLQSPLNINSFCVKKVKLLAFLICVAFGLSAQKRVGFDVDAGAALPMSTGLKNVFDVGLSLNLALPINLAKEKLYLRPVIGVKWFFKEVDNSVQEHFRTGKTGLEIQYKVKSFASLPLSLYPIFRVDYNWSSNYFSQDSYDPISNTNATATSSNFLKGSDPSYAIGAMARFERFYVKIDYEIYMPTLTVDDEVVKEALEDGIIIAPTQKLELNTLTLSLGYTMGKM